MDIPAPANLSPRRDDLAPAAAAPLVSVVLPVRNEARHLRACLMAVLAQDYPADRQEVLVVDGGSRDGTRAIVAALAERDPRLRLLDNPGRIVSTAMNIGIAAARGDIIVRVDGHAIVAPDYVRQCVATLERTGAVNAGGPMRPRGEGRWGAAVALATASPFGVGNGAFHDLDRDDDAVDTVYLGAFRRAPLLAAGGFDEGLVCNQDDELNFRLRAAGGRIALSSRIHSTYFNRTTPRGLWRQYWRYGEWKVAVLARHPASLQPRHAVPPLFAVAVIGVGLLRLRGARGRHLWLAVAVPWLAGAVAASARAVHGHRAPGLAAWLPLVFAVLHLSYGLGFLWGLARWLTGWRARPAPADDQP
ncbi:MAG: glycosyltransferase family 2 protein [Chloroflexi bacterium]|nr:glycosyltransferase family 2 protein [Chloroflexota bacterium]